MLGDSAFVPSRCLPPPTSKGIVTPTFDSINQVELFQKIDLILKTPALREHISTLKETLKSVDELPVTESGQGQRNLNRAVIVSGQNFR